MLEMTAELATPDSLDSLDRSEGEEEQGEKGLERTGQEGEEREEENSLLNEEEKDKSSPTIQLARGGHLQVAGGGGGSPDSSQQIAVSRDVVVSHCSPRPVSRPRCVSVCGPRPLRVSVVCCIIISVWVLLVFIMHLDKKVTTNTSA